MRALKYFEWLSTTTITANGNTRTSAVYVSGTEQITLFVNITEVSGTSPTLDLYIDVYDDVTEQWYELAHVGTFTATGTTPHNISVNGGQCFALRWVVGGTSPSFKIKIGAEFRGE